MTMDWGLICDGCKGSGVPAKYPPIKITINGKEFQIEASDWINDIGDIGHNQC